MAFHAPYDTTSFPLSLTFCALDVRGAECALLLDPVEPSSHLIFGEGPISPQPPHTKVGSLSDLGDAVLLLLLLLLMELLLVMLQLLLQSLRDIFIFEFTRRCLLRSQGVVVFPREMGVIVWELHVQEQDTRMLKHLGGNVVGESGSVDGGGEYVKCCGGRNVMEVKSDKCFVNEGNEGSGQYSRAC